MTPDFVLHVGPMKTATTYVQYILEANRGHLEKRGWSYPGQRPNQQHAFYGLCGRDIPWIVDNDAAARYTNLGQKLVASLTERDHHAIVSSEALASLTEAGIESLLRKIPHPTRIVFTLRPLQATIKSGWQQFLKRGGDVTLDDFVNAAMGDFEIGPSQEIPLTYLYGDAVRRWRRVVRCPVHVADVPSEGGDPDATWQVFRAAAGLPELPNRDVPRASNNRSLSKDAAELLRRFNATFIASGTLRHQRQREFVRSCLLAEPHLPLGAEKIEFGSDLLDRIGEMDGQQRDLVHEHATEIHSPSAK